MTAPFSTTKSSLNPSSTKPNKNDGSLFIFKEKSIAVTRIPSASTTSSIISDSKLYLGNKYPLLNNKKNDFYQHSNHSLSMLNTNQIPQRRYVIKTKNITNPLNPLRTTMIPTKSLVGTHSTQNNLNPSLQPINVSTTNSNQTQCAVSKPPEIASTDINSKGLNILVKNPISFSPSEKRLFSNASQNQLRYNNGKGLENIKENDTTMLAQSQNTSANKFNSLLSYPINTVKIVNAELEKPQQQPQQQQEQQQQQIRNNCVSKPENINSLETSNIQNILSPRSVYSSNDTGLPNSAASIPSTASFPHDTESENTFQSPMMKLQQDSSLNVRHRKISSRIPNVSKQHNKVLQSNISSDPYHQENCNVSPAGAIFIPSLEERQMFNCWGQDPNENTDNQVFRRTFLHNYFDEPQIKPTCRQIPQTSTSKIFRLLRLHKDSEQEDRKSNQHQSNLDLSVKTRQKWNTLLPDIANNYWKYASQSHIELTLISVENAPYIGEVIVETTGLRIAMPFNCRFLRLPYVSKDQIITLWFNSPLGRRHCRQSALPVNLETTYQHMWVGTESKHAKKHNDLTTKNKSFMFVDIYDDQAMNENYLQSFVDSHIHPKSETYKTAPPGEYTPKDDYLTYFKFIIPIESLLNEGGTIEDAALLDPKGHFYNSNNEDLPTNNFKKLREGVRSKKIGATIKFRACLRMQGAQLLLTTKSTANDLSTDVCESTCGMLLNNLIEKPVYVALKDDTIDELVARELNRNDHAVLRKIGLCNIKRIDYGKYSLNDVNVVISDEVITPEKYADFDFSKYSFVSGLDFAKGKFHVPIVHNEGILQPLFEFLKRSYRNIQYERDNVCAPVETLDFTNPQLKHFLPRFTLDPDHVKLPYSALKDPMAVNDLYRHGRAILTNLTFMYYRQTGIAPANLGPLTFLKLSPAMKSDLVPHYMKIASSSRRTPVTFSWDISDLSKPMVVIPIKEDAALPYYLIPDGDLPLQFSEHLHTLKCDSPLNHSTMTTHDIINDNVDQSEESLLTDPRENKNKNCIPPYQSPIFESTTLKNNLLQECQQQNKDANASSHILSTCSTNAMSTEAPFSILKSPPVSCTPSLNTEDQLCAAVQPHPEEPYHCSDKKNYHEQLPLDSHMLLRQETTASNLDEDDFLASSSVVTLERTATDHASLETLHVNMDSNMTASVLDEDLTDPLPLCNNNDFQNSNHQPVRLLLKPDTNQGAVSSNQGLSALGNTVVIPQKQNLMPLNTKFNQNHTNNLFAQTQHNLLDELRANSVTKSRFTGRTLGFSISYVAPTGEIVIPSEPPLPSYNTLVTMTEEERLQLKQQRYLTLARLTLDHHRREWYSSPTYKKLTQGLETYHLQRCE